MMKKIIVAVVAFILACMLVATAKAEDHSAAIRACANQAMWKSVGVGAVYGGGVMLVASGLVAATSTVAVPAGVVTAAVVGNTVVGALVGGGAAAASMAWQEGTRFTESPLIAACKAEIGKYGVLSPEEMKERVRQAYHRM